MHCLIHYIQLMPKKLFCKKNFQRLALALLVVAHLGCAGDECNSGSASTNTQSQGAVRVINATQVPIDAKIGGVSNGSNIAPNEFSCYQTKQGEEGTTLPIVITNHDTGAVMSNNSTYTVRNLLIWDLVVYGPSADPHVLAVIEARPTISTGISVVDALNNNTIFDLKRKMVSTGDVNDYGKIGPNAGINGERDRIKLTATPFNGADSAPVEYDLYNGTTLVSSFQATVQNNTEYQLVFTDGPNGTIVWKLFTADDTGCIGPGSGAGNTLADVMNAMATPANVQQTVNADVGPVFMGDIGYGTITANATVPVGQQPLKITDVTNQTVFAQSTATLDSAHRYGIVGVGNQMDGYDIIVHTFGATDAPAPGHAFMTIFHGIKGLTETTDFYIIPSGMTLADTPYTWKGAVPLTSKTIDVTTPSGGYTTFQIVATEPGMPSSVVAAKSGRVKDQWSQFDVLVSPPSISATFTISNEGTTLTKAATPTAVQMARQTMKAMNIKR